MRTTERFKELYIDIFIKVMQIIFAVVVIGPFVAGKFDLIKFSTGLIASLVCIGAASRIALSINEKHIINKEE